MKASLDRPLGAAGTYGILGLFGFLALYPIVGIVFSSVHPPGATEFAIPTTFDWSNFGHAWHDAGFSVYMRNSAIIAATVAVVGTILSLLGGYAFGTMRFRGADVLFYGFLTGLVMPAETMVVPLYFDFRSVNLTDTYWSVIIPETGLYLAFGIFWMRAYFRSVPRSLIEASRMDGASSWTLLWRVLIPFGRPAILTLVLLFFMWSWNEFLLPLVMTSSNPSLQTLPVGLAFFQGARTVDFPGLAAGGLLVAGPVIVVYVFLQRHFLRGMLSGAIKG